MGNADRQGDRPLSQVNFEENGISYFSIEIEFGDAEGCNTDIVVGRYLVNLGVAEDYRDAERTGGFDVFKALTQTNLSMKYKGEGERAIKRSASHLGKYKISTKAPERNDFEITTVWAFSRTGRKEGIDEEAGVGLVVGYEQRMEVFRPWGGIRMLRMWRYFPF